jgi:hypothetical protein
VAGQAAETEAEEAEMKKPPWYQKLEDYLRPRQDIVTLGLLAIIGISLYLLVKGDPVKRTFWLVYLISP